MDSKRIYIMKHYKMQIDMHVLKRTHKNVHKKLQKSNSKIQKNDKKQIKWKDKILKDYFFKERFY